MPAKKGHRRPLAEVIKIARGTQRPCRQTVQVVEPLAGEPVKPIWLTGEASTIWDTKVAIYLERRQAVRGCEAALAQYCALEAALVNQWRSGMMKPMAADLAQYRIYANEFYDTPASQESSPKFKGNEQNPFARNGRLWQQRS